LASAEKFQEAGVEKFAQLQFIEGKILGMVKEEKVQTDEC
jgi:hypothetical protein